MSATRTSSTSAKSTARDPRNAWALLAAFAAYFVVLWWFWDSSAIYPVKIFVVFLHEISHGIAAVLTGGFIDKIVLEAAQGGACHCPGGNAFLTLTAGYLGSLLWGCLLVIGGLKLGKWSRSIAAVIGVGTALLTVFYVRGSFGMAFGLAFALFMLASARWLPVGINRALIVMLGLTSCLYALLDIKSDVLDRPELQSDARMLAELTGVPTVVWGVIWIGVGLAICFMLLRRAVQTAPGRANL